MFKKIIITFLISVLFPVLSFASTVYIIVPQTFMPQDSLTWKKIEAEIIATTANNIVFYWQGFGGQVDEMITFVQAMEMAQLEGKRIIVDLIGNGYSAHAIAPCYADQIENNETYFLMFHLPQNGATGDIPMSKDDIRYANELLNVCVKKGIMSQQDLEKYDTDNEVYVFNGLTGHHSFYKPDRRRHQKVNYNIIK